MKKRTLFLIGTLVLLMPALLVFAAPVAAKGFMHGIPIDYNGNTYYFAGEPVGDGWDVPGHDWVQAGPDHLIGKHYNTGPGGASKWWSSDAPDGELLYIVDAIIDSAILSPEEEAFFKSRGYIHRHELIDETTGLQDPNIYVYLKHTARTSFTLDGGPGGSPNPPYKHQVTPGIDYEFPNNW